MPIGGRQRWIIEATWGASSTEPDSYTLKKLGAEGTVIDAAGEAVNAVDLSDAAMMAVRFPAALGGSADKLKFVSAAFSNGPFTDKATAKFAQDKDGADIEVSGVQSSLDRDRDVDLSICSRFFVKPIFVQSDGTTLAAPGAVTVTFMIKE